MREGIQIHFHDHSMMVGQIDTYNNYANFNQSYEDILEEADFEVVGDEDSEEVEDNEAVSVQVTVGTHQVPAELNTEKARRVLGQLRDIGVLDENYQPLNLSWSKRGYLAYQIALKLGVNNVWTIFSNLWNVSASVLRTKYNESKDMPSMADFDDKLKKILG